MSKPRCPNCQAEAGKYRYSTAMTWLGIVAVLSLIALCAYTGVLLGVLHEKGFMDDVSFSGRYQTGIVLAAALTLSAFMTLIYLSGYERCENCGHCWKTANDSHIEHGRGAGS